MKIDTSFGAVCFLIKLECPGVYAVLKKTYLFLVVTYGLGVEGGVEAQSKS